MVALRRKKRRDGVWRGRRRGIIASARVPMIIFEADDHRDFIWHVRLADDEMNEKGFDSELPKIDGVALAFRELSTCNTPGTTD
jgi:hypothetical protein